MGAGRRKWAIGAVVAAALALGAVLAIWRAALVAKAARPAIDPALLVEPPPFPADGRSRWRVTWTGAAGVRLESAEPTPTPEGAPLAPPLVTTILVDPYVTRHAPAELAFPLDVDETTAIKAFPRADAIFVGHSHHDHLSDAIYLARTLGASLYGSPTSCALAIAQGLERDRCREFADGHRFLVGPVEVEVVASAHSRTVVGVPFDGVVAPPAPARPYAWELKTGGVFAFVFRVAGRTVYHQGTAGLTDAQLQRLRGLKPDLALVSIAARAPEFEARLLEALQPRRIAAIHHDDWLGGRLSAPLEPEDPDDVRAFEREVAGRLGLDALERLVPFRPVELPAPATP